MNLLNLFKNASLLIMVVAFLALNNFEDIWTAAIPLLVTFVFPFLMVTFLHFRTQRTQHFDQLMDSAQNSMVDHVVDTVENFRLVADYVRRPHEAERYEEKILSYNKAFTNANMVQLNNLYFAPWLTVLSLSLYILW